MNRIVIVTGMAGAGRTTALKVLEDLGFEAVDNLPINLLRKLVQALDPLETDVAIGIDPRSRTFDVDALMPRLERLRGSGVAEVRLLFLDCDDEVLRRRYSETRRRHPLAFDRSLEDGIAHERQIMAPLRGLADHIVDTTALTAADLKRVITGLFDPAEGQRLAIHVMSFSFRNGLPREADLVFDVRFLRNPHYDDVLRPMTGLDRPVQDYVANDLDFSSFMERLVNLLLPLLPRYRAEGKSYLTIAIGCTGGKHRSVFVTEALSAQLRDAGWAVGTHHRDIPRTVAPVAVTGSTP
ncbi:RNase adapter RapZ [Geminicoccus harenae]|uniref:RNase adapter RapZ n=1 Tax=Geminicoccus harenae TaxID=2498453 RepID=UPI001CC2DE5E|nr:RNase adapter RapZ [Geminicoccus harenae]